MQHTRCEEGWPLVQIASSWKLDHIASSLLLSGRWLVKQHKRDLKLSFEMISFPDLNIRLRLISRTNLTLSHPRSCPLSMQPKGDSLNLLFSGKSNLWNCTNKDPWGMFLRSFAGEWLVTSLDENCVSGAVRVSEYLMLRLPSIKILICWLMLLAKISQHS